MTASLPAGRAAPAPLLGDRLAQLLAAEGSVSVADFMALAVGDRQRGYYAAAEPFGRRGDFITAPEVSQLFGEIIAVWVAAAWQALGSPAAFTLCEGGPGRGTLSDDILRSLAKAAPACAAAADMALLETSRRLRRQQRENLAKHRRPIIWVENCAALSRHMERQKTAQPLIFIANELFDALPVRQYQKSAQGWRERRIKADAAGRLHFALGAAQSLPEAAGSADFARQCAAAPNGAIIEISAARADLAQGLSRIIARRRGAALLIDYGSLEHGFGDTLQAVSRHAFAPILENIGGRDISSHVDFAALAAAAQAENCRAAALTQGAFLLQMGLLQRAGRLGAGKSAALQRQIRADVERLAAPEQMGTLFKALCIADKATFMPPFAW